MILPVRGAKDGVARSRHRGAAAVGAVDETASLLGLGARALADDGDLPASRQWFEAAYREAERLGDATAMGVAVLGLSGLRVHEHRTASASALLHARLRQTLCLLQPRSSLGLRLRARLAGEADYRVGTAATILSILDEARGTECALARADALSLAHHCLLGPDHGELRRALADELVGASARTQRRSDLLMGLLWQTVDLVLDADPLAERRLVELSDDPGYRAAVGHASREWIVKHHGWELVADCQISVYRELLQR